LTAERAWAASPLHKPGRDPRTSDRATQMQNAGDYLTDVGFRLEGDAMVQNLA
jgi:hypothetical protein